MLNSRDKRSNSAFKGFILGVIVAIFAIAVLLWYLNYHYFNNFQKDQVHKEKLNDTSKTTVLSFPDLNNKDNAQNIYSSQNNIADFKDKDIDTTVKDIDSIVKDIDELSSLASTEVLATNSKNNSDAQQNPTTARGKDNLDNIVNDTTLNKSDKPTAQNYTLQIGFFYQQDKAKSQVAQLVLLNIPAIIKTVVKNEKEYFKVLYPNISYNKALSIKQLLQKNNINSVILKE